jgi:predicted flap endonuclease-1-like 5' DNA nuclease
MSIHAVVKRIITKGSMRKGKVTRRMKNGKGFSKAELEDGEISINEAMKYGIPIDARRSTKHEENVNTLKTYVEKMKSEARAPAKEEQVKTAMPIEKIEGIGPTYAKKLIDAGIKTTEDLLESGSTPKGRENLVSKTGISAKLILEWVNLADLLRIKGVGEEYSDLLEEAGVDTVVELSRRVSDNLHAKILEVNEEKKLVRRPPTLNEVRQWIEQAKKLPRKVEY